MPPRLLLLGRALQALWTGALDLAYPLRCVACDRLLPEPWDPVGRAFCPVCREALEPCVDACRRCAAPMVAAAGRCPDCARGRPAFQRAHAAFLYGGPLLEAVHALKYGRRVEVAGPLGALLADAVLAVKHRVDLVVPVPLHPRRLRERGFDQAERLATVVGRRLGRPVVAAALRRARPTVPQASAGREARLVNVLGAFAPGLWAGAVKGRRVLLVDDVLTTGATASACAGVLTALGARGVEVAVLARAE